MIIKELYIGNSSEAFIEKSFSDGFNILFSYDNNKGKTIVMQSLIYALGGEPMFPNSFNYKEYFYIVKINQNEKDYVICRKNDSFIIKTVAGFNIFNSLSEYKYYFNKVIYKLPQIIKDGRIKTVDIALLCELFFLPQSNRNTSNIINYGYYKKQDFENMLFSIAGLTPIEDSIDVDSIKEKIKELKREQSDLKRQNGILTQIKPGLSITSLEVNRIQLEKKLEAINALKNRLSEAINTRNRLINRKTKDELLEKELRSLNRTLPHGTLKCLDCGSTNIGYTPADADIIFDVSDNETKKNILSSISARIELTAEEIEQCSLKIEQYQKELQELLKDDNVDLTTLLLVKPDIINSTQADLRLSDLNKEIKRLENLLKSTTSNVTEIRHAQGQLKAKIISDMGLFYSKMEPSGNSSFNQIYTTTAAPYSGSEETEFYLAKLFAFAKNICHPFPIIVDGFREGEIDSTGERIIITEFKELENQIIFTATLKGEEKNHFSEYKFINAIDYSSFADSKILTPDFVPEFKRILSELGVVL